MRGSIVCTVRFMSAKEHKYIQAVGIPKLYNTCIE